MKKLHTNNLLDCMELNIQRKLQSISAGPLPVDAIVTGKALGGLVRLTAIIADRSIRFSPNSSNLYQFNSLLSSYLQ